MRISKQRAASAPAVDDLIALAQKEGLEDGWNSAGSSDDFEQMVRAEIQAREWKVNGHVEPDPNEQIEQARSRKQTEELRKQAYETKHAAALLSEQPFSWQRWMRVCAMSGLLGLFLGLAGAELDWRGWLVLGLGTVLVLLRPKGIAASLRAGLIRLREDVNYLKSPWCLWRFNAREDKLESRCGALQLRREEAARRVEGLTRQVLGHYGAQRKRAEVANRMAASV